MSDLSERPSLPSIKSLFGVTSEDLLDRENSAKQQQPPTANEEQQQSLNSPTRRRVLPLPSSGSELFRSGSYHQRASFESDRVSDAGSWCSTDNESGGSHSLRRYHQNSSASSILGGVSIVSGPPPAGSASAGVSRRSTKSGRHRRHDSHNDPYRPRSPLSPRSYYTSLPPRTSSLETPQETDAESTFISRLSSGPAAIDTRLTAASFSLQPVAKTPTQLTAPNLLGGLTPKASGIAISSSPVATALEPIRAVDPSLEGPNSPARRRTQSLTGIYMSQSHNSPYRASYDDQLHPSLHGTQPLASGSTSRVLDQDETSLARAHSVGSKRNIGSITSSQRTETQGDHAMDEQEANHFSDEADLKRRHSSSSANAVRYANRSPVPNHFSTEPGLYQTHGVPPGFNVGPGYPGGQPAGQVAHRARVIPSGSPANFYESFAIPRNQPSHHQFHHPSQQHPHLARSADMYALGSSQGSESSEAAARMSKMSLFSPRASHSSSSLGGSIYENNAFSPAQSGYSTGLSSTSPIFTPQFQGKGPLTQSTSRSDYEESGPDTQSPYSPAASASGSGHSATRYTCPFCSKKFSRPSSLRIHVYSHTGEKPYTCELCHRGFSVQSNLRRHLKVHKTQQSATASKETLDSAMEGDEDEDEQATGIGGNPGQTSAEAFDPPLQR
ncbi:uncharacterized protein L969DRAFT_96281 [Mixia osmundae IAM 14324]|uniref:C2H2-type domain-containing protein n=1 Tax=Mixia osmundae (strain CBS 9802 / IAM 14324 / JCM 22182 / KY 12970) TaxID=764103 RepID=G7E4Z2_MIXOS|nr:uncharacterized protein L969DRAFT_96281 [Mixia osmundae IAM 14324]KEI37763.1 hypothetical protein L969DRAFT_96281 [Mixia osmundae IAM 14324]GAA97902.1 hypothetical protein E5Q_04582 [Mixia osmundae IAM 14324]